MSILRPNGAPALINSTPVTGTFGGTKLGYLPDPRVSPQLTAAAVQNAGAVAQMLTNMMVFTNAMCREMAAMQRRLDDLERTSAAEGDDAAPEGDATPEDELPEILD